MTESPEVQTIHFLVANIEQFAVQAARDNYYGLQYACLLIAEALGELAAKKSPPTPGLFATLNSLPRLIEAYGNNPHDISRHIIEIVHHPGLNIMLTDDELAILEAQLRASAHQETDTGNEKTGSPLPVSNIMQEIFVLLQAGTELIDRYLLCIQIDKLESVDQGLQQIEDELARYANACSMAGFEGLALVCEQVATNIELSRHDVTTFTVDKISLLRECLRQIKIYLASFREDDAGLPLLAQLSNPGWPSPLQTEAGMTILAKLRLANFDDDANPAKNQTYQQVASERDVSLTLPDDVNQELLEVLLQELPVQTQQFSKAIQRLHATVNAKDLEIAQRIAHAIKDSANTVGIKGIAALTHHLEKILVAFAKEEKFPGIILLNVLADAADCLESMSESLTGMTEAPQDALTVLQDVLDWANHIDRAGIEGLDNMPSMHLENDYIPIDNPVAPANTGHVDIDLTTTQSAIVSVSAEHIENLFRISGESITLNTQVVERLRWLKNQLQSMELQFNRLCQLGDELDQLFNFKEMTRQLQGDSLASSFNTMETNQYNELHNTMVETILDAREMTLHAQKELEQMHTLLKCQQRLVIETQEVVKQTRLGPIGTTVPRLQRSFSRKTGCFTGKLT